MSGRKTRYTRLETDPEDDSDDELPPAQVQVSNNFKASRWNHIENLDEFFDRVYQYKLHNGLFAIVLNDVLELVQFAFVSLFSTFIITCVNVTNLLADKIYDFDNGTKEVAFHDVIQVERLQHINPFLVLILLFAFVFWFHRLCKTLWRAFKFYEIRTFYHDALKIPSSELRDCSWLDILNKLKQAQNELKLNIRKQELSELDVYHRMLRFTNYMVAMINKGVLPVKQWVPFYGEKVFFTQGLKYNYEILLFWGPGAPFKNHYHLHEEYKTAAKKYELVQKLKFRITILALINLIFTPLILLYQILYSFFSYAELLKRQPGMFSKRHWSLYGKYFLRHFNEVDHELLERLNRAYLPAGKYMDLFVHPIATIIARNIAFIAGSLFAVLLALTLIQEDLLTAHNVLTSLTILGVIITVCRVFIPIEYQVRNPGELMHEILSEIHYMPDNWKDRSHTLQVNREFSQVFQFISTYLLDELLSPVFTPFILYFSLRAKSNDIVDFLRNFTIDVSGVGDVCSFAEMNPQRNGHPEWQSSQLSNANTNERGEYGKVELSLIQFSRKNPNWSPSEDCTNYISQMKESVEDLHNSNSGVLRSSALVQTSSQHDEDDEAPPLTMAATTQSHAHTPFSSVMIGSMTTSLWASANNGLQPLNPVHIHQVHDVAQQSMQSQSYDPPTLSSGATPLVLYDHPTSDSSLGSSSDVKLDVRNTTSNMGAEGRGVTLNKPLITRDDGDDPSNLV